MWLYYSNALFYHRIPCNLSPSNYLPTYYLQCKFNISARFRSAQKTGFGTTRPNSNTSCSKNECKTKTLIDAITWINIIITCSIYCVKNNLTSCQVMWCHVWKLQIRDIYCWKSGCPDNSRTAVTVSSVSSRMNSASEARISRSVSVSITVHCSVEYEIQKPHSAHYSAKKANNKITP